MFCPRCAKEVKVTEAYCPHCNQFLGGKSEGVPVKANSAPVPPAPVVLPVQPVQPLPAPAVAAEAALVTAAQPAPEAEEVGKGTEKFCVACGARLPVDAAFCLSCGARQTGSVPALEQRAAVGAVPIRTEAAETALPAVQSAPLHETEKPQKNKVAIAALICAFLAPLVGFILGIVGINKAKTLKGEGKKMSIAAIVIGIVSAIVSLAVAVLLTFLIIDLIGKSIMM